ncbi:ABC transporter ATP-binding protein [bacterium]|nr:ABC transporter ATP-binding protein [bacterium]
MSLLDVKNLNLGFNLSQGFKQVLYDVSFSLDKGKMLAIVGESGCGKTLTAMSILNLLPKNAEIKEGNIFFKEYNLLEKKEFQLQKIRGKNIALIPQDPMTSLNPLYTIENQIVEIIKTHRPNEKKIKEIALKSLKDVKIPNPEERLKSYPHELSGGMKQRIIIAMALACNADLIIADEPTTALDVTVQAQIMKLLKEIKETKNTAIILITHDLGLVFENADYVAVMYAGRIVEYSSKKELFENPKHPYTKALFNSIPDIIGEKLIPIEGQPPSINDSILGCPFNPRCKYVMDICTQKNPELLKNNESMVSCWLNS